MIVVSFIEDLVINVLSCKKECIKHGPAILLFKTLSTQKTESLRELILINIAILYILLKLTSYGLS